jgi:hypothetical protein
MVGTDPESVEMADKTWCYEIPAGTASPLRISPGSFNTQCWAGGMGEQFTSHPIHAIQLVVPGNNTTAIPFDFCLTDVTN